MAINNALGQDGGTGTQVVRSNGASTPPTFEDVETCALPIITGATYATIGGFNIATGSSGVITGLAITDGGSGTIDIASGTMFIRTTASDVGVILSANFAGDTAVALTDNSINFVYIDYNAGTPQTLISTVPNVTPQDNVVVGIVWREGSDIHISAVNVPTPQVPQKLARRLALVDGVTRQSGLVTGETGTRELTITAGSIWLALADSTTTAFDSSGSDTWIYYFRDGSGGWTAVAAATQINNTQYDNNSGALATLNNNQYGVHWVYQSLDDQVYIIYGQDTYTLTEAQDSLVPATTPLQITNLHTILIAKIIIQKSASSFTEILLPWESIFAGGLASAHNDLSGIQGGAANDYFHITSAQHVAVVTSVPTDSGTATATANALTITGGTGLNTSGATTIATINLDVPVVETNGGTGQTTYASGDILYASASNTLSKLAKGSDTEVLTLASGVPSWAAPTVGTVTSVSGTASRISSTGGTTPVIDIDGAYVGQATITTLGTVTTGTWTGTAIAAINGGTAQTTYASGDILYASATNTLSKLAKGSDTEVLTLASGVPSWAAPTVGTVTSVSGTSNRISSTGGATPVIDIDSAYVGQATITTLGTIATGVWTGTAVAEVNGGTAQTTYTAGDILYASAANTLSKLAIGSDDEVLTLASGLPTWAAGGGAGDVTAAANLTDNLVVRGDGGVKGVQTSTVSITDAGEMTNASQPAFLAYVNSTISNVTGDGTVYLVIQDTEVFDQNADFNIAAGLFTAPVTGKYAFSLGAYIIGGTSITAPFLTLISSNFTYLGVVTYLAASTAVVTGGFSVLIDMDAADTASCNLQTTDSGGKIDDVGGLLNGAARNFFSGFLSC